MSKEELQGSLCCSDVQAVLVTAGSGERESI